MTHPLALIPFSCGWGAKLRGCADGPSSLKKWKLAEQLAEAGLAAEWGEFTRFDAPEKSLTPAQALPLVARYNAALEAQVAAAIAAKKIPVTLGGDHSMAVGTWSGVTRAMGVQKKLGLIWFDAHLDAHTPRTSPSLAYHGMPVAVLLGDGAEELTSIGGPGAKIAPQHLCLIGIRSFEEAEHRFLADLGVRVFYMDEIKERGMKAVMQEALTIATTGADGFGITVDLDGFDPYEAPGVGSPEGHGFSRADGLAAIHGFGCHPGFVALEIAEYNPYRDRNHATSALVRDIIVSVFEG